YGSDNLESTRTDHTVRDLSAIDRYTQVGHELEIAHNRHVTGDPEDRPAGWSREHDVRFFGDPAILVDSGVFERAVGEVLGELRESVRQSSNQPGARHHRDVSGPANGVPGVSADVGAKQSHETLAAIEHRPAIDAHVDRDVVPSFEGPRRDGRGDDACRAAANEGELRPFG